MVERLDQEDRAATAQEQATLAGWSGWGALPQVFDETNEQWADQRATLRTVLTAEAYDAARQTTINAHYTDPRYVAAIWQAVEDLGFDGGRVLEPGCGSGTFIGLAPAGARMVGVELDPTTAAIARGLYPAADIRTESFADSRLHRDTFDAAVGNVPFADVRLHDPAFNGGRHSLHNHFIIKSLALTRPGGVVAVLTSSFTLDAANPAARREMADMADLLGAVRLPTGAHSRTAGTEVVTDLLVLRRREPGQEPADRAWELTARHDVEGGTARINQYFLDHPEHVLGQLRLGHGMYGLTVQVDSPDLSRVDAQLQDALADITSRARSAGRGYEARVATQEREAPREAVSTELWDGTIVQVEDSFKVAHAGRLEELRVPSTQRAETTALIGLRDGARALLEAEATTVEDTEDLEAQRRELRNAYTAYVDRYGPLNRYTAHPTGHYHPQIDPNTGDVLLDERRRPVPDQSNPKVSRRAPAAVARFRQDPYAALVSALEVFDQETQTSAPAALLLRRSIAPRPPQLGADTPAEAIAISLDRTGGVDLDLVAGLLGLPPDEARAALGSLVFEDPQSGALIYEPEYLSGNVRTKLDVALEAAAERPELQVNVDALRQVLPPDIPLDQIEARMGAVWISPEIHEQFLSTILRDPTAEVDNPLPGQWVVRGRRHGIQALETWGTQRRPATDIAEALMEQRRIVVEDTIEDGDRKRTVLNAVETTAAQEKAAAMQERFSEWVWEDPERARELTATYNRTFNSLRLRDYTTAGDYLTLPGLAASLTLRPHQRAAVARMVAEPSVGLFHQVGAGKTLEMIVGATEMRRMGLIRKPLVVVPNHMLEQFSREWLQAYPAARILAASTDDLSADKRRQFVARAAANDWDGIVLTQGAFKTIAVSPDFERRYISREVDELRTALDAARAAGGAGVKRVEKAVLRAQERLKKKLDITRDPGISFEEMSVDYLLVDEAHMYKNLATVSNIRDAAIEGSAQAADLHMKLEYLREREGSRVATLATATPLANSITEAYVMQRYLRPDLLKEAGLTSFDGWAATFGSTVTDLEVGPAGGFRIKDRFARFQNVPEMLRMWSTFADVKTGEDLHLPVPQLAPRASDGQRDVETIVLEPTAELQAYIDDIGERAKLVGAHLVEPSEDNMLSISTDGRKAAVDVRLVEPDALPTGQVKLDAVADQIMGEWERTRERSYIDSSTGQPSAQRGGLQLVFCDLGTPNAQRWDAYTELRSKLADRGMPTDRIRFIHEAGDDRAKAALFRAARAGQISVLMGSTAKMGVGTNVQDRITAVHHIDCPWRPADLEQRDGRAVRQGNQNGEVGIFRYVVERSFDAYLWQTVTRKAKFIAQVMRGKIDSREIEDIGATAPSAAMTTALATGDPMVLEHATATAHAQQLRRAHVAHERAQKVLAQTVTEADHKIAILTRRIELLVDAESRTTDVSGDRFAMTINGRVYDSRADAADALGRWASTHADSWRWPRGDTEVGTLAGHTIVVTAVPRLAANGRTEMVPCLSLLGVPGSDGVLQAGEFLHPTVGTVRALENRTTAIPRTRERYELERAELQSERALAVQRIGKPFAKADELAAAEATLAAVNTRMQARIEPEQTETQHGSETTRRAATFPAPAHATGHPKTAHRRPRPSIDRGHGDGMQGRG